MNVEEIIESYRGADEATRYCLFLDHRDLREVFSAIDQEATAATATPRRRTVSPGRIVANLLAALGL